MIRTYRDALRSFRNGPTRLLMRWVSHYLGRIV